MQRKNLIVVHLESFSNSLYHKYAENIPYLQGLLENSECYEQFVSSATSTMMVMASLLYGTDAAMDRFDGYGFSGCIENQKKPHLFEYLKTEGYRCGRFVYPDWGTVDEKRIDSWGLWDRNIGQSSGTDDIGVFLSDAERFIGGDAPFAMYVHPLISHAVFLDAEKKEAKDPFAYYSAGFHAFDSIVKRLHASIEECGKGLDTLWLFVGDHGDSFVDQSFNGGFFHGTEPYFPMINCPMFFVGAGVKPCQNTNVISTDDCYTLVLDKLNLSKRSLPLREYAFSQNFFANQEYRSILNKSYSVYDGRFLLMVSYLGLELYDCKFDAENRNNLLSFFSLKREGLTKKKLLFSKAHRHFTSAFTAKYFDIVIERFFCLKRVLEKHVRDKEADACAKKYAKVPTASFAKIRKRKFYWFFPVPTAILMKEIFKSVKKHCFSYGK